MLEMDSIYAGYGFASHKGYPTPEHCRALKELGAVPIHRRSFGRVRQALGLDPVQEPLFDSEPEPMVAEQMNAEAMTVDIDVGNRADISLDNSVAAHQGS